MIENFLFPNDIYSALLSCFISYTYFDLFEPKIPPLWETLRLPPPTGIQNLNLEFSSNLEQSSKLNRNARKNDFDEIDDMNDEEFYNWRKTVKPRATPDFISEVPEPPETESNDGNIQNSAILDGFETKILESSSSEASSLCSDSGQSESDRTNYCENESVEDCGENENFRTLYSRLYTEWRHRFRNFS